MAGIGGSNSNLYDAVGGREACRGLSTAFYARVARDPLLRPLFPGKTFTCAMEEFAAFLAQFLGGPGEDSQRRWWLSLRESHLRFKIGEREREAWLTNMAASIDDVQLPEPWRSQLLHFFARSSAYVVNQSEVIPGPERHDEISQRWDAQRNVDEATYAIRTGDLQRAIELLEAPILSTYNRSVTCDLLALMLRSRQPAMLDYVYATLSRDPPLARERYAGRTLLHEASAAGNLNATELLLKLGVDPNVQTAGRHTPLYCAGNECAVADGGMVVRALVAAGANVNASDGVKRCTALHMAARRGHVEIAEALLDCGADIEARDSLGETPLRRSVNCNQDGLAALLVARGADIHSPGSRGLTPRLAARTVTMKQLLQNTPR